MCNVIQTCKKRLEILPENQLMKLLEEDILLLKKSALCLLQTWNKKSLKIARINTCNIIFKMYEVKKVDEKEPVSFQCLQVKSVKLS